MAAPAQPPVPLVAIIGRANVGKSTLFNALTRSTQALVADVPGVTRDRHFGRVSWQGHAFLLVDTGGLVGGEDELGRLVQRQAKAAVAEADAVLLVMDGKTGPHPGDEEVVEYLRTTGKPVFLVVNKIDHAGREESLAEFYRFGLSPLYPVSAAHKLGLERLLEAVVHSLPLPAELPPEAAGIRVAVVGRPNVGKSSFINRVLGEERLIVSDTPGTTRDVIDTPLSFQGRDYVLIDTAGLRRPSHVAPGLEKYMVLKAMRALERCDLTVHVSTKLNRSHLHTGKTGVILPCLGRTELDVQASGVQFVTVENSTGVVHRSQGGKTPASPHLLSEPKIVAELAKATLGDGISIDWDGLVSNYDNIRNLIEQTIPGFERYNERVRRPGGFYLPNGAREGKFNTSDSKAHFTINSLPEYTLRDDEFLLMTIRSHDQYNTTIYGMHDRYRGIRNGRYVVFVNPDDMKKYGLQQGDKVDLVSRYDGVERRAKGFTVVPYQIPRQNLAAYFPEANSVVPHNHVARGSHTPISKSVIVRLQKAV